MTSNRLAVIVPTRGRPENIRKVLDDWDFTGAWADADLVLAIDADDPRARGYRSIVAGYEHRLAVGPGNVWIVEHTEWMPMVHKLEKTVELLLAREGHTALGFAGDDHFPRTIGWARRYLDVLAEMGAGMVFGDDKYQGGNLSTEWAVSADLVRLLGRMVPASVEHMYCDNAILDLYRAAGAVRFLPEIVIEHMHPIAGKVTSDEQYRRVNSSEQFKRDRRTYETWKSEQMPIQLAQVRQHRKNLPTFPLSRRDPREIPRMSRTRFPFPRFFKQVQGLTPDEIGLALADMAVQVPADQAIVELGTYHGRTALQMAWGARQGHGAHLWAFDPWDMEGNEYEPYLTDLAGAKAWARHHVRTLGYNNGITLTQKFSVDAAKDWSGPMVGLLFVDGDHSYAATRADILAWAAHMAPGAPIAVDDYGNENYPEVATAVDDLIEEGYLEPVQIFHDRLAVTRLTGRGEEGAGERSQGGEVPPRPTENDYADLPVLDPATLTAVTSEGVSPSPELDDVDALFPPAPDPDMSRASLGKLRSAAKARGITGAARMNRSDLLKALIAE